MAFIQISYLLLNKIYVEGCDVSFSCRYSGFSKFRCEILRGWNEELGKLFEQTIGLFGIFMMIESSKSGKPNPVQERINQILEEYDKPYNEGMKIFAYHSDCDGEITPEECVLLLKSFERVDPEKFENINIDDNDFYRESYIIWKKMMAFAIENNESMIFG